jgi:hypothetical protein
MSSAPTSVLLTGISPGGVERLRSSATAQDLQPGAYVERLIALHLRMRTLSDASTQDARRVASLLEDYGLR